MFMLLNSSSLCGAVHDSVMFQQRRRIVKTYASGRLAARRGKSRQVEASGRRRAILELRHLGYWQPGWASLGKWAATNKILELRHLGYWQPG